MTERPDPTLPLDVGATAEAPPRRRFRARWLLVLLIPPVMFTGAVIGMYFQPPALREFYALTGLQPGAGSKHPIALPPDVEIPPAMAETMLPSDVVGLARIMPRGDIAIVAAPYGAGDARVAEILVETGMRVVRGQPLARLDNRQALEGAVLLAEANLAVRQATFAQTRSGIESSRAEAQAALNQARATAGEAAANLTRTEELHARGVATAAMLEAARAAAESAAQAMIRAEATLSRFASLALDDQPDVVVAARNVAGAEGEMAGARLDLGRSEVLAPIDGTILDIRVTPGQRPPADGLMKMGDIGLMMAEVEVWQDRIAAVAPGQPVELAAAALGRTLRGTVARVGLLVGRQGLISDDAAANTDARVIRVLVALDEASSEAAQGFTNLEVIARIDTTAAERAAR